LGFEGPLNDPRLDAIRRDREELKLLEYYEIERTPVMPLSPILMSGEYIAGDAMPEGGPLSGDSELPAYPRVRPRVRVRRSRLGVEAEEQASR
jgi:hypothetical protein